MKKKLILDIIKYFQIKNEIYISLVVIYDANVFNILIRIFACTIIL